MKIGELSSMGTSKEEKIKFKRIKRHEEFFISNL